MFLLDYASQGRIERDRIGFGANDFETFCSQTTMVQLLVKSSIVHKMHRALFCENQSIFDVLPGFVCSWSTLLRDAV